jgi:hypothetical protein
MVDCHDAGNHEHMLKTVRGQFIRQNIGYPFHSTILILPSIIYRAFCRAILSVAKNPS